MTSLNSHFAEIYSGTRYGGLSTDNQGESEVAALPGIFFASGAFFV
jgi:hypothetical protein